MKWNLFRNESINKVEVNLSFIMDDMDQMAIIETLTKAKDEIVRQATEEIVKRHLQDIVSQIDVKSLVNAVYLRSTKKIIEELNK